MNKYNNSKIYKIVSNQEPLYYYIGSTTTDLKTRLRRHKADSKIFINVKKNQYFNSINWDVQILLIEDINVSNLTELHEIENNFIKKYFHDEKCLNTYHAIVNKEKEKQKAKENGKKYYNEHINEMREKHNEYYLKTKKEKHDKYEENKKIINEYRREKIVCECGITISRGYN